MDYSQLNSASWQEVVSEKLPSNVRPLSVHIPLQLPFSDHLLHADCGFNAVYLPVLPDIRRGDEDSAIREAQVRAKVLSFAFGELPFVAHLRQVRWRRLPDLLPAVQGVLSVDHLIYTLTYAVDPASGVLYINVALRNEDDCARKAVIRIRSAEPVDKDYFPFHYRPYLWNDKRYQELGEAAAAPEIGEAEQWEAENRGLEIFEPAPHAIIIRDENMLTKVDGSLCLTTMVDSGKEKSFTLRHTFGKCADTPMLPFAQVLKNLKTFWDDFNAPLAKADFGNQDENIRFLNCRYNSMQLLLQLKSPVNGTIIHPCQGGTSERHNFWIWEAMCSLLPLLKTGITAPIREVVEFFFLHQDNNWPPEGEFKSVAGAIGTTGPRWANATGAALKLAADYLFYSDDKDFADKYIDRMIKAAQWIINEIRDTRKVAGDGSRIPGYGLMPPCCATDGDYGIYYCFTDSVNLYGLRSAVNVFQKYAPQIAGEMAAECELYQQHILDAAHMMAAEDGSIKRFVASDNGFNESEYDDVSGANELLANQVAEPDMPLMQKYISYRENKIGDSCFWAKQFGEYCYIGNGEEVMHYAYLLLGEWKKAWKCARIFREFGMTPDLFITQERCSLIDDGYTPWQPNASNNGRYLKMLLERLILEHRDTITLLGSISPVDFVLARGNLSLTGLHTRHGMMDLIINSGKLKIRWQKRVDSCTKIRFPEHFRFIPDNKNMREKDGFWYFDQPFAAFSGKLEIIEKSLM